MIAGMPSTHASSSFWGALLTVDYAYRVIEQLSIGGGVAGGIVWWAGLAEGNPFTAANASVSGAIPMPTFGLSLHADYRITPHLFVTLRTRAFVYSKTTSDGPDDRDELGLALRPGLRGRLPVLRRGA